MAPGKRKKIALIDDDLNFLSITEKILVYEGYEVSTYAKPQDIFNDNTLGEYDLVISDLVMPEIDGIEVLKYIKEKYPGMDVIVLTGNGTIDTAVEAIKLGAATYVEKPAGERFLKKIKDIFREQNRNKQDFLVSEMQDLFIGNSRKILKIKSDIEKIAKVDSCVLITGNSGTGKEVIANLLHKYSLRSNEPFIKVNCAAIPDTLFESELFGHEKGAFTGALKDKKGKFELADKGTLFLDEIGDLSILAQTKILRTIQERAIDRIGGESIIRVDYRLICATNRDLETMVAEGKFREDLFYRINVARLNIPPLCERKEDIPEFIRYFCRIYEVEFKKHLKPFGEDIIRAFLKYDWPGNVRELKNVIERIYIFAEDGNRICLADLPTEVLSAGKTPQTDTGSNYRDAKYEFERNYLLQMLAKNNWNISNTAKEIGLSRRNLHEKINQFNLKYEDITDE